MVLRAILAHREPLTRNTKFYHDGKRACLALRAAIVSRCRCVAGTRRSRGEKLLKEMEAKSASVCEVTFGIVFDRFVKRGDFDAAQRVFDELQRLGFKANATHHTSFMQS